MSWKHGLVAVSVIAVVTLLLFTVPSVVPGVVNRGAERAELADDGVVRDPTATTQTSQQQPEAAAQLKPEAPSGTPGPAPSLDFVLSSFNVLGNSHTARGGTRVGMAPGETRIRSAIRLLERHRVDVVGFQELQLLQLGEFLRVTGGRYAVYPGDSKGGQGSNNSIAWRTDKWELVAADTIAIPYFNGSRWPMPVVLLRDRDTGLSAYFSNFHNPASTPRHPNQGRWRRLALAKEVALVNRLMAKTDYPVFLTGDLNQRESAFCTITKGTAMVAANGGGHAGFCRPPPKPGIDWIFGSTGVSFTNYRADRSPLVNRTTDHPMIVSDVRIRGGAARR